MWQPRVFGIFIGWLAAVCLTVFFFSDKLIEAGLFGDSCKQYGLSSWSCGVLPKLAVWLPNTFMYFLKLPFTYDGSWDLVGAQYATMLLGSPVAYVLAFVALNYWIWKLNTL